MTVIEATRELGKAIQADERYTMLMAAKEANDKDDALNALIGKLNLIQMSYQHEAEGEANEEKMNAYDKEFREVYTEVMANANMRNYEEANYGIIVTPIKNNVNILQKKSLRKTVRILSVTFYLTAL